MSSDEVGVEEEEESSDDQLWVMIKLEETFHSGLEDQIEEELIEMIEGRGLARFDGHSSGMGQFDLKFFEVDDYDLVKSAIKAHLKTRHPQVDFVISKTYETTFDRLPEG